MLERIFYVIGWIFFVLFCLKSLTGELYIIYLLLSFIGFICCGIFKNKKESIKK